MSFTRHTNAGSHLAYVRSGHNLDNAFQKSVSGAPMPTKKKILLQQATTVRAARKLKQGKVLKATSITKKAVCLKKEMIPKVA
jgi:hypothetical protein